MHINVPKKNAKSNNKGNTGNNVIQNIKTGFEKSDPKIIRNNIFK